MTLDALHLRGAKFVVPLFLAVLCVSAKHGNGDEPVVQTKELKLLQLLHHDDLEGIYGVEVSRDGKHLYAPSFRAGTVVHFAVDHQTRLLRWHVETIHESSLQGATDFRLFSDDKLAVSCACHAKTVVLYKRNVESGRLTIVDVFHKGDDGTSGVDWPVRVSLSPDEKFLYVGDSKNEGKAPPLKGIEAILNGGAVSIFQITDDSKLNWVDSNFGEQGCFGGTRGVLCHPNGRQVFATTNKASTLVVCERDSETGLLRIGQVFRNGEEGVECLSGAISSALSPDGRSLYTCAGRFVETGAIGVFRIGNDGVVSFEQQFINERDGFKKFRGGDKIIVSRDGRRVYASAYVSGSLAIFERNLETGRLQHLETLVSGEKSVKLLGANGMAFDPAGKYLYLACEEDKGIAVFEILQEQADDK